TTPRSRRTRWPCPERWLAALLGDAVERIRRLCLRRSHARLHRRGGVGGAGDHLTAQDDLDRLRRPCGLCSALCWSAEHFPPAREQELVQPHRDLVLPGLAHPDEE